MKIGKLNCAEDEVGRGDSSGRLIVTLDQDEGPSSQEVICLFCLTHTPQNVDAFVTHHPSSLDFWGSTIAIFSKLKYRILS